LNILENNKDKIDADKYKKFIDFLDKYPIQSKIEHDFEKTDIE
jgi:hypothetical protein